MCDKHEARERLAAHHDTEEAREFRRRHFWRIFADVLYWIVAVAAIAGAALIAFNYVMGKEGGDVSF